MLSISTGGSGLSVYQEYCINDEDDDEPGSMTKDNLTPCHHNTILTRTRATVLELPCDNFISRSVNDNINDGTSDLLSN
jgi:hypothetical protein